MSEMRSNEAVMRPGREMAYQKNDMNRAEGGPDVITPTEKDNAGDGQRWSVINDPTLPQRKIGGTDQ